MTRTEAQTRKELIDVKLGKAGWNIGDKTQVVEEINFEGSQIEKQVINKGTNALIVKEFMEECIKDTDGVLPGKTIFFCSSMSHARRIEKIFDSLYPEYCGIATMITKE
ncbi:MAG: hypothetical protein PF503_03175 [Desulfobacula sp.]|jgi:type I site-specific restriction endonuclease|nr:hypothetical protein [Desulfobacula sp.]